MKKALLLALIFCGCSGPQWKKAPHDRLHQKTPPPELHELPSKSADWEWWQALLFGAIRPLGESLSPGNYLEAEPALDINHFGQVLESPWFTPRLGAKTLAPEEVAKGGETIDGPSSGEWWVTGGKVEGATPGLVLEDGAGVSYVVKFDPPAFPELASGAEIISSKILWAAGYNVPENYLAKCNLRAIKLKPGATTAGEYGDKVPFTEERLHQVLVHVNPLPDGTVRALFSRVVAGIPIGNGNFRGVRADDPNDLIPHERRRSLRGLWLFSAWINNADTGSSHILDVFTPVEGTLGYVKHYLLDFNDTLGSGGTRSKYIGEGYEHQIDWQSIFTRVFTFGIVYQYWLPARRSPFRSVGVFESEVFEPAKWRPHLPNPAFDRATKLDTYWAASIIARFTPEMLQAIVARAELSEPGAADWIVKVLLGRQKKILEYAFEDVLPLDDPRVEGRYIVAFTDLAQERELLDAEDAALVWRLEHDGNKLAEGVAAEPKVDLSGKIRDFDGADPFVDLVLRRKTGGPELVLHLRVLEDRLLPVGLER